MFNDYGYAEDNIGQVMDGRLFVRLLPFFRPYARQIGIGVVLVLLMTALDIGMPHVIRVALDRYIVPPETHVAAPDAGDPASGHPADKKTTDRFLSVDTSDADIRGIVARHPDLFLSDGNGTRVSVDDLDRLDRAELTRLRRNDIRGLTLAAGIYLLMVILNFGLFYLQMVVVERAGQGVMHDMRMRLYRHIQSMSLTYFNRRPVGRLVTRATNDIQNMHELFTSVVVVLFKDVFLLVGLMIVMLVVHWRLALICFAVLPVMAASSVFFSRLAREAFREQRVRTAEINTRFAETIAGIRVIQTFLQEAANLGRFREINEAYLVAGMKQVHVFAVFMPFIELLASVALGLLIWQGGIGVMDQSLSLGILVAFISYSRMLFNPIRDMAEKYNILQNAMSSAERIFRILETDEQESSVASSSQSDRENGAAGPIRDIEFEEVSFAYTPDEPVLKSLSLRVEQGRTVALVGPTGSGKTSLVHLLFRFYEVSSGRILVNGADIRDWPLESLRGRMALVSQDPFLFSESLRENIRIGAGRELADDELTRILDAARCGDVLRRAGGGPDAALAEGGASLSSGERQLVSIARALARDPDIIILDEATSYIDSETEARVQEALRHLLRGRTAIVVAHRLSTARNADLIVVLRRGRIVESGNHEELMRAGGFYCRLHRLQGAGE